MEQGYLTFEGIECVYSKDADSLIVTPKNKSDVKSMFQHYNKTNFILEYQHIIYQRSFTYIEKIEPRLDHSFIFLTKYTVSLIGDYEVNEFILTGDEIDVFFSPISHFFQKKSNNEPFLTELLYEKEEVVKFIFTLDNKSIYVSLFYGEILKSGIKSDLKLHSHLSVEFDKTKDINFLYSVYQIIVKFLQIVRHQKNTNLKSVEILGTTEKVEKSILGYMYSKLFITKHYTKTFGSEYIYFKPFISNILQLIADDKELSIRHLPLESDGTYSYDVLRYLSVFSAFEYECKKQAEEYLLQDDESVKVVKSHLLQEIKLMRKNTSNENEKNFLTNANNQIIQLGTQYGQVKKIINAYNKLENVLKESIPLLLPNGFKLSEVASKLTELRAKIAHDNLFRELTDLELKYIRFLDVLSYTLLLKRSGVNDEGIELIIGNVFQCNFKYMEFKKFRVLGEIT
jgi:hypothetical protein